MGAHQPTGWTEAARSVRAICIVCLDKSVCSENIQELAKGINTFLWALTADFTPLTVADDFTADEGYTVPDSQLCE